MVSISSSVGQGGVNIPKDVAAVQTQLNPFASKMGLDALKPDGRCGPKTIDAIRKFQALFLKMAMPDGHVDPNGKTWVALAGKWVTPAPVGQPGSLSGAAWWKANQAKYPNSDSLATLDAGFQSKVVPFLDAMKAAGLSVSISSTRRNRLRAYLMHYCWDIANGTVTAAVVPLDAACPIVWNHGSDAASKAAALEMVKLFGIKYRPSLNSRHIDGLAIDMSIIWTGVKSVTNKAGKAVALGSPTNGAANKKLHEVGRSYGVVKNVADEPHWSTDGH